MNKKRNKTAMAMSVAVLTLVLMGTACSNNNNTDATPSATPSLTANPSVAPETEGTAPLAQEGTGIYEGQIDNNSIEIKTETGPTAFQITPEIGEQVSSWEPGTEVKYQFTEEGDNGEKLQRPSIIKIDKQ
jgi:hypothetical protein